MAKGRVARGLRWSGLMLVPVVAAGTMIAQAGTAYAGPVHQHGPGRDLYVSPSGQPGAADRSCGTAGYQTIGSAINAAPAGVTTAQIAEMLQTSNNNASGVASKLYNYGKIQREAIPGPRGAIYRWKAKP